MTLDEDVISEIRRRMRERGAGFKETVNDLLRRGLRSNEQSRPTELPRFSSGQLPGVDLDKALSLAGGLDDDEAVRKLELRK